MNRQVPLQVVFPGKLLVAERAFVRPLLRVFLHVVGLQVAFGQEPLVAQFALVPPFPVGVRQRVPLEVAALAEVFPAIWTRDMLVGVFAALTRVVAVAVAVAMAMVVLLLALLSMLLLVVLLQLLLVDKDHGALDAGVDLLPVFSHVALQGLLAGEHGRTLPTLERVLLKEVMLEILLVHEGLHAVRALIAQGRKGRWQRDGNGVLHVVHALGYGCFFVVLAVRVMHHPVSADLTGTSESLPAILTLEGFDSCMSSQMLPQVAGGQEPLVAVVTQVRPIPDVVVRHQVALQIKLALAGLHADGTLEGSVL